MCMYIQAPVGPCAESFCLPYSVTVGSAEMHLLYGCPLVMTSMLGICEQGQGLELGDSDPTLVGWEAIFVLMAET